MGTVCLFGDKFLHAKSALPVSSNVLASHHVRPLALVSICQCTSLIETNHIQLSSPDAFCLAIGRVVWSSMGDLNDLLRRKPFNFSVTISSRWLEATWIAAVDEFSAKPPTFAVVRRTYTRALKHACSAA